MSQNNESFFALPQGQFPPYFLSLRELRDQRHRYLVVPSFQRGIVWTIRQCQGLIDTILRGEDIPPLEGYQTFSEAGESFWSLIDGYQRITAILRFLDGEFRTWSATQKELAEPHSDPPVEPTKYFKDLSPIAKNYLLDYRLMIVQVRNQSPQQLVTRFLRINQHVPLTVAERLRAQISRANTAAMHIETHPFWEDFYDGKRNREQLFQCSLNLIGLEIALPEKTTVDLLSRHYYHKLASGRYDNRISDTLIARVWEKLDKMALLYHGAHFTRRSITVPMYQSVHHIESTGYAITQKDKGVLATWIMNVIAESNRGSSIPNYAQQIQHLLRKQQQKIFWERHLRSVLATFGTSLEAVAV